MLRQVLSCVSFLACFAVGQAQAIYLDEALRLATNRYRAGYSGYLEQLDAQRGLLSADLALVSLQADALAVRVQLYQALGGGWTKPVASSENPEAKK